MNERLTHCPRCAKVVDTVREYAVKLPNEISPMVRMEEEPAMTVEQEHRIEEWYQYDPCGCVVPPEERREAIFRVKKCGRV